MTPWIIVLIGVASFPAGIVAAFAVAAHRAGIPPENRPKVFLEEGGRRPGEKVVVCLGASHTHGRVSFNFVEELTRQLEPEGFRFVNAGRNGDLAWNALQRLPSVVSCRPDFVTVLVGTNDVIASMSPRNERMYRRWKRLPQRPSILWYRENILEIVARLKRQTTAEIALVSLSILGEDLVSDANQRVRAYNAVLEEVAEREGVTFLQVFDRQARYLQETGAARGRAFTGSSRLMFRAMIQQHLLGWSLDRISARNGLVLLTELIHLNSRAGTMLAEAVAGFLRGAGR